MSQELFSLENVLAKIRFTRLHQKIKRDWHTVRKQLVLNGLSEQSRKAIDGEQLNDKDFALLLALKPATFSKSYRLDPWIFDYVAELWEIDAAHGQEKSRLKSEFWGKLSVKRQESLSSEAVIRSSKYEAKIVLIQQLLNYTPTWEPAAFDWILPDTTNEPGSSAQWPLAEFLQKQIKPEFIGTTWKMYRQKSHEVEAFGKIQKLPGVHKMILRVTGQADANGFYRIYVLQQFSEEQGINADDIEYEGVLLTDNRKDTQKMVAILKDASNRYAHMILFTEDFPKNQKRTLCLGHFTYFANRPNVNKYLTKTIIIALSKEKKNESGRVVVSDQLQSDEQLIFRYLSDKNKNRLSSTTDHLYSINGLKEWLNSKSRGQNTGPDHHLMVSLRTFCRSFYVYFVKKYPLQADQQAHELEFVKDLLVISESDDQKTLAGKFTHIGPAFTPGTEYVGGLSLWKDLFHGQLMSEHSGPLYITFRTNKGVYQEGNECFVGLIAGERDGSNSAVSYTCVVVPVQIIDQDAEQQKEQKVKSYLRREARQGWAVVDPSTGKSNKFKISALASQEDERKYEEGVK